MENAMFLSAGKLPEEVNERTINAGSPTEKALTRQSALISALMHTVLKKMLLRSTISRVSYFERMDSRSARLSAAILVSRGGITKYHQFSRRILNPAAIFAEGVIL